MKIKSIKDITDENCFLFLWGTWAFLSEALRVIDAWGFTYKTSGFVWVKTYQSGKDVFGMGNYTRGNTEYVLLAVKGLGNKTILKIKELISNYLNELNSDKEE